MELHALNNLSDRSEAAAVCDPQGIILNCSGAFSGFFPSARPGQSRISDCFYMFGKSPKSYLDFYYSSVEHEEFWGHVTGKKLPDSDNTVYYFESLRKRPDPFEQTASAAAFEFLDLMPGFQNLQKRLQLAIRARLPILLTGDIGQGRNLLASYIHTLSNRRNDYLVSIDCSAIPFFDQERMIFGSPRSGRPNGLLWKANKGIVHFQNIEYLSLAVQKKLYELFVGKLPPYSYNIYGRLDIHFLFSSGIPCHVLMYDGKLDASLYTILNNNEFLLPEYRPDRASLLPVLQDAVARFCRGNPGTDLSLNDELVRLLLYKSDSWLTLQHNIEAVLTEASNKTISAGDVPRTFASLSQEALPNKEAKLRYIETLLSQGLRKTKIAKAAGISRATLYRYLQELEGYNSP